MYTRSFGPNSPLCSDIYQRSASLNVFNSVSVIISVQGKTTKTKTRKNQVKFRAGPMTSNWTLSESEPRGSLGKKKSKQKKRATVAKEAAPFPPHS